MEFSSLECRLIANECEKLTFRTINLWIKIFWNWISNVWQYYYNFNFQIKSLDKAPITQYLKNYFTKIDRENSAHQKESSRDWGYVRMFIDSSLNLPGTVIVLTVDNRYNCVINWTKLRLDLCMCFIIFLIFMRTIVYSDFNL